VHIEGPTLGTAHLTRARGVSPRRLVTAAITTLACAALVSACGSSSSSSEGTAPKANVDTPKVALSIEQTILTKLHLKSKVVCPAPMPAVPGSTFECIATSTNPKTHAVTKTPFVVTIQTPRGFVTYVGK
jgi:hypothetical protein